ncbi:class I SAM-dependent methyltransferase [Acinetobacter sp. BSP-28]|uniref:class I SAM-dependent methyltransferase n=1 Tax=Acinetobacter sp. BSP-28 TaxID=3344661 RepID=UPI00376F671E
MISNVGRKPHVVFENRFAKAKKIESIIELEKKIKSEHKLLEVGTGSGGIAFYFASHYQQEVFAVDISDNRQFMDGYNFQLVSDTKLPYADNFFDIVISNHVIEHVGEKQQQQEHLDEINRVLKPGGILYLAVPNRWMLIEPHYQLIFLSWLPKKIRSYYLKKIRNIAFYDCEPLEKNELENLFSMSELTYKNYCIEALHIFVRDEKSYKGLYVIFKWLPLGILKKIVGLIPTLIYLAKK